MLSIGMILNRRTLTEREDKQAVDDLWQKPEAWIQARPQFSAPKPTALASSPDPSGVIDKHPVLAQACRTRSALIDHKRFTWVWLLTQNLAVQSFRY